MTSVRHVRVFNNCDRPVTVHFRHRRPMKGSPPYGQLNAITLQPKEESDPLPYHSLVGAKGWTKLAATKCVRITTAPYQPLFGTLVNNTSDDVVTHVTPAVEHPKRGIKPLRLKPGKESRIVHLASVSRKGKTGRLIRSGQVKVKPMDIIGPSTGRPSAVGSHYGESVYICYECGGPIIFRGSPPGPIHIR